MIDLNKTKERINYLYLNSMKKLDKISNINEQLEELWKDGK